MLVSSHLMGELQDMADQVVVVGRGRVLADASVEESDPRASGDEVLLRTPSPAEAAAALERSGAVATVTGRGTLTVTGMEAQRIVEVLHRAGRRLLRGHHPAGQPGGRLLPAHRRRSRIPRQHGRAGGTMSLTGTEPAPEALALRASSFAVGAVGGVGQAPHGPGMDHCARPRRRSHVRTLLPGRSRPHHRWRLPRARDRGPDRTRRASRGGYLRVRPSHPLRQRHHHRQDHLAHGHDLNDPANVQGSLSSSRPGLAPWAKAGLLVTPSTGKDRPTPR